MRDDACDIAAAVLRNKTGKWYDSYFIQRTNRLQARPGMATTPVRSSDAVVEVGDLASN